MPEQKIINFQIRCNYAIKFLPFFLIFSAGYQGGSDPSRRPPRTRGTRRDRRPLNARARDPRLADARRGRREIRTPESFAGESTKFPEIKPVANRTLDPVGGRRSDYWIKQSTNPTGDDFGPPFAPAGLSQILASGTTGCQRYPIAIIRSRYWLGES